LQPCSAGRAFFFLPEIPLAAVHEIPSPNRSPTKLGVGRAGKTVRPHCYNSLLCAHAAVPLRAARRTRGGKKSRFPFALCSPGNSVAVDGSRKDQVRRRRSTARSDLPPDRTALLGPRHAVVPGAVGQRLQITGLRQVRSLTRFGRIRAFWNFWGGSGCSVRVNFDGLAVKLAWLLLAFATSSRLSIRTTSPLILHHTKMNPIVRIILITSPDSRDNG